MQLTHVNDAAVLRAFANPARLRLLGLLRTPGPATVGMLAAPAPSPCCSLPATCM